MKRGVLRNVAEWLAIVAMFVFAAGVRYLLIQPPEVAHACEASATSGWCVLRTAVIQTFATYGLGYACALAAVTAVLTWNRGIALIAAVLGAAGLILYCYEPGAVSLLTGVLLLARAQSGRGRLGFKDFVPFPFTK